MNKKNKNNEELQQFVEEIFKKFTSSGLYICDLATGGGKSHTIAKFACNYYLAKERYDRIVILCVQNKLVLNINKEIDKFINKDGSLLKPEDKLVVENNVDVIRKAVSKKHGKSNLNLLIEEMNYQIEREGKAIDKRLRLIYKEIKKEGESLANTIEMYESYKKEEIEKIIRDKEENLRHHVRNFFDIWRIYIEKTTNVKVSSDNIRQNFRHLQNVYPQIDCQNKKVLLTTIHKAMYGIDPILSERVDLQSLASDGNKTLFVFDESDMAAIAMRDALIDQSIKDNSSNRNGINKYNQYLQYLKLTENPNYISTEYHGELLKKELNWANQKEKKDWQQIFGKTIHCNDIVLNKRDDIETFRKGVFFSGPVVKLNIGPKNDNTNAYICCNDNDKQFSLAHSDNRKELEELFDHVVPEMTFIGVIDGIITMIKSCLSRVAWSSLKKSRDNYNKEVKAIRSNTAGAIQYLGYPTLEREVHTLFSRFGLTGELEKSLEQQLIEFITNTKNVGIQGNTKIKKIPDYSVYFRGIRLYQEEIDEKDNHRRVRLTCREIATTPEKILYNLVRSGKNTVVLCSATASNTSVISNFDIEHLGHILGNKMHYLSVSDKKRFDELVKKTYPKKHDVKIVPIQEYEDENKSADKIQLPERYRKLFDEEALKKELVDDWFRYTKNSLEARDDGNIKFSLNRLLQFAEVYKWFNDHKDVHSLAYFQNQTGKKDSAQFMVISCLIDGTWHKYESSDGIVRFDGKIPTDWVNDNICITKEWEELESGVLTKLEKGDRIMLVAAYSSFKVGVNLQYKIPKGLKVEKGNNWDEKILQKDWDAIYLQCPKNYLTILHERNSPEYEKELYNVMLGLMMLFERGCLSEGEVKEWMYEALEGKDFKFGDRNNGGVSVDKAAWVQGIIQQAVGRLCRTRNKPRQTYILYDESMSRYFSSIKVEEMSLTKEFRTLATYILEHPLQENNENNLNEIMRCYIANYAYKLLLNRLSNAYCNNTLNADDEDYVEDDDIPHSVITAQEEIQSFKKTIIKKPVISDYEELNGFDRIPTFINKCYGDWERNEKNECIFYYKSEGHEGLLSPNSKYPDMVSPSAVRLDVLMKNPVIRKYFEENGYATDWKRGGKILHPNILKSHYAGEIGEEAFKAIVLKYTDCTEEDLVHLKGKDYELADFVVLNPDGSYKIAFDVKNMDPDKRHDDRRGDIPTSEKRQEKKEELHCELITVNMLKMEGPSMDENREILGLIDKNGFIIPSSIERLKDLINN